MDERKPVDAIPSSSVGLPSQENWINWMRQPDRRHRAAVFEHLLFSDAHITGQIRDGLGPYSFLNSVPTSIGSGSVNAPIILRAVTELASSLPDMSQPDESLYHGGTMIDELAALASLALGARILAGGISREFGLSDDPLGQPREGWSEPRPPLHFRQIQPVLPAVIGSRSMDALKVLESIPHIAPSRYIQLVRACRSYQQALWAAESDPNMAWLLLVSALETAANDVITTDSTPEEILRVTEPALTEYLEGIGGSDCVHTVAEGIAHTLKATGKFIRFTTRFLPPEPEERPDEEWLQVKWTESALRRILGKVYKYRSRSLHAAIPFPNPMIRPPFRMGNSAPASEAPLVGKALHSHGGTWTKSDAPINLHCFHYIARGALLKWWKCSLVTKSSSNGS